MGGRAMRRAPALACAVAVGLIAALVCPVPASAETADEAKAKAAKAAAEVRALQPQLASAERAYEDAVGGVAAAVTAGVGADRTADALAQRAQSAESAERGRIRALYMSGGSAGVWGSVLAAGDAQDALRRIETVNRVVTADRARSEQFAQVADGARVAAATADRGAEQAVLRASDVNEAYARMNALLSAARARLASLDARAQQLAAVEEAQRQLAELQRQADAAALARAATATARVVPADYFALYRAAAGTCPGLPWTVIAAIGQVETGHGTNVAVSPAGAQGPMQFMPATFAAYAVDGDRDGRRDIMSPADSVFTAARYLCANGGGKPGGLPAAVFQYNHADWYVAMVLRISDQLATAPPTR